MRGCWGNIAVGVVCLSLGTMSLWGQRGITYWGFPLPDWGSYFFVFVGVVMCTLAVLALLHGKEKSGAQAYTNEDFERDKAALDQVYLRQHGTLPERPRPEQPQSEQNEKR